jgi:hypothetical protein
VGFSMKVGMAAPNQRMPATQPIDAVHAIP